MNLIQLFRSVYVWWLKREFVHQIQCLEAYLAGSAFDLDVSPHVYRKRCAQMRGRIRDTASKLKEYGVDYSTHKEHLKWL